VKNLLVVVLCLLLGACANLPSNRFTPFADQISSSNKIGVVVDSFGINDVAGRKPGYNIEKNIAFSEVFQGVIRELLEADGHTVEILHASRGLHVNEAFDLSEVFISEEGEATEQLFSKSLISDEGDPWADESLDMYFKAVLDESFLVNRKPSRLGDRVVAYPGGKTFKQLSAPDALEARGKLLAQVPEILTSSKAETILFVRVAGLEHNRAKGIAGTVGTAVASLALGKGGSAPLQKTWNSTSPMQAVAINARSGQIIWYEQWEGGRYSESHEVVKKMLRNFPQAN